MISLYILLHNIHLLHFYFVWDSSDKFKILQQSEAHRISFCDDLLSFTADLSNKSQLSRHLISIQHLASFNIRLLSLESAKLESWYLQERSGSKQGSVLQCHANSSAYETRIQV